MAREKEVYFAKLAEQARDYRQQHWSDGSDSVWALCLCFCPSMDHPRFMRIVVTFARSAPQCATLSRDTLRNDLTNGVCDKCRPVGFQTFLLCKGLCLGFVSPVGPLGLASPFGPTGPTGPAGRMHATSRGARRSSCPFLCDKCL